LSVVVLGDESGYALTENQKMKLAAIEAMWETEPPPASFTAFGIPDKASRVTHYAIRIPWVMGLIGTRSIDRTMPGINELVDHAKTRIRNGLVAYDALERIKANRNDPSARADFAKTGSDLGYALLLKQFVSDPRTAGQQEIESAAWSTVPGVLSLFFSFRIMVLFAFFLVGLFGISLWYTARERPAPRWLFRVVVLCLPLPWIAAELGWFVAEFGRQPWIIEGVLPTALATSELGVFDLVVTITGFTVIYGALAVIEIMLMIRAIRKGPDQVIQDPSVVLPAFGRESADVPTVPRPAE
jgi:cytochrome d ubiquinol oxidase subunit I